MLSIRSKQGTLAFHPMYWLLCVGFSSDVLRCSHFVSWQADLQLDAYVPSAVSQSGGMRPVPPNRHQHTVSCGPGCSRYPSPALRLNPVQTIGPGLNPSEFDPRIDRFHQVVLSEKFPYIPDNVVFPCHCPGCIHIPSVTPEHNPGHGHQIVVDIGIRSTTTHP